MDKAQCIINKKTISLLGANSKFGKLLSLLLKQSHAIKQICLYDENSIDTAADISTINTPCKVRAFCGRDQLPCALKNADIILIADKSTFICDNTDILLDEGAPRIIDFGNAIAESCTQAIILVAATPVNILLPLLSKVLTQHNAFNCDKVFGVTAADNVRANAVLAQYLKRDPGKIVLPVVGGSSPDTRVPIFSQSRPQVNLSKKAKRQLKKLIKHSDGEIFRHKGELESINKAYATSRFVHSVLAGLRGEPNVAEIALTRSVFVPGTNYFALPFILGQCGAEYRFPLPQLTKEEEKDICLAVTELNRDSKKGEKYLPQFQKGVAVVDSKDKGIMVGGLLDHLRSTLSSQKANVEYTLMTKKPELQVPLTQNPSKTPIPSQPLEPFPHCYEGCNPLDLPELPLCRRRAPPHPNLGTCCNLEDPPKRDPPCKSIGTCNFKPCDAPFEGSTPPSTGSGCCYGAANNNDQNAQQCCNAQNAQLVDKHHTKSNQQDQPVSHKNSNKMVLAGKTNPVKSRHPSIVLSPSSSSTLQNRSRSKNKNFNHAIILGPGKEELKMQLPKNESLISEHLSAMKGGGNKLDDNILKIFKVFEDKIKKEEKINEEKAFSIFKNIYYKFFNPKIDSGNNELTDKQNFDFIEKNLPRKNDLLEAEKSSKAATTTDKQSLLHFIQSKLKEGKDSANSDIVKDVSLVKQHLLKSLESDLLKDKFSNDALEVKSSTDSKAIPLLESPTSNQILLNFLKNELKSYKTREKSTNSKTDPLKDTAPNLHQDLLKSLEKYLKEVKSNYDSGKVQKSTNSKTDPLKDATPNINQHLLKSPENHSKEDKSYSDSKKIQKSTNLKPDPLKEAESDVLNSLLKSLGSDLKKDIAPSTDKKKINNAEIKSPRMIDESNANQDLIKSFKSELKKDKSHIDKATVHKQSTAQKSDSSKESRVKQKLLKSFEMELKKDELLKNNIKVEKTDENKAKFLSKLKQDLEKSLESELQKVKYPKNEDKDINQNTGRFVNFASKMFKARPAGSDKEVDRGVIIKRKELSIPLQRVSTLDKLKSYFLNQRSKKSEKIEKPHYVPVYSRFENITEGTDDKSKNVSSQMYAPQCPSQYLFGEYIPHTSEEDNVNFGNVIDVKANKSKPYEDKLNKSTFSQPLSKSHESGGSSFTPSISMKESNIKAHKFNADKNVNESELEELSESNSDKNLKDTEFEELSESNSDKYLKETDCKELSKSDADENLKETEFSELSKLNDNKYLKEIELKRFVRNNALSDKTAERRISYPLTSPNKCDPKYPELNYERRYSKRESRRGRFY